MTTQDDEKKVTAPSSNDDAIDTLSPLPTNTTSPGPGVIQFRPTMRDRGRARASDGQHVMFNEPLHRDDTSELMGPLLRRKKIVSMPLGQGGDFFVSPGAGGPHHQLFTQEVATEPGQYHRHQRVKQKSQGYTPDGPLQTPTALADEIPTVVPMRKKQDSNPLVKGILRRKQVSLDLLGPNDFFATDDESIILMPPTPEEEEQEATEAKLFRPLRFAPRSIRRPGGGGAHGASGHGSAHGAAAPEGGGLATVDEETVEAFHRYSKTNQELKLQIISLKYKVESEEEGYSKTREEVLEASDQMIKTHLSLREDEKFLKSKLNIEPPPLADDVPVDMDGTVTEDSESAHQKDFDDSGIIRATRNDKIKCGILVIIMLFLTIVVSVWDTESNEEGYLFGPVGLACVTPCEGNLETHDFFNGHSTFSSGEIIELIMNLDQYPTDSDVHATVEIVGVDSGIVKATKVFGPPDEDERITLDERVTVNFDNPQEEHIINVNSTISGIDLSFTLEGRVLTPLAEYSILIAALIMICVYAFILIEVIHRTLVALFGSMVALMFLFIMENGETETIRQIMLNLEWSTLGLLFGMMLIVGELSHTGIFEWCAVRLLMASKGSFSRLMVLLCTLTAVASAFLDNVTTMLLVAPVTIDMCTILGVDPRPYLIGEVLLSNIGGTATLIGDPPNIIIGSSYEEIGFVDFVTDVLPCIFLFCVPASLLVVLYIYRYYLTSTTMRVLDTDKLKKTYPIYDEPRLMIAGTVTFFVIVMFFLHPVHHKDTAWIALLGAFITIGFTNPHDVQDALRNHVEWDTLLFFAGLFVLVEVCAAMGLLDYIGDLLADYIQGQPEDKQLSVAITLLMWVSAVTSAFLDNIPYTATMIPVIQILADTLPETLSLKTLAWALSFGACLGGNGTLLGASANIVTAGIATNKGYDISFLNFFYPGMVCMIVTVAIANLYMLVRFSWLE